MVWGQRSCAIFGGSQRRPSLKKSVQFDGRRRGNPSPVFALLDLRDTTGAYKAVDPIEVKVSLIVLETAIQHCLDQTYLFIGHAPFAPPWHYITPWCRQAKALAASTHSPTSSTISEALP
jgi:hypothetical protein